MFKSRHSILNFVMVAVVICLFIFGVFIHSYILSLDKMQKQIPTLHTDDQGYKYPEMIPSPPEGLVWNVVRYVCSGQPHSEWKNATNYQIDGMTIMFRDANSKLVKTSGGIFTATEK